MKDTDYLLIEDEAGAHIVVLSWRQFLDNNELGAEEESRIERDLDVDRLSVVGGGAAPTFTLKRV